MKKTDKMILSYRLKRANTHREQFVAIELWSDGKRDWWQVRRSGDYDRAGESILPITHETAQVLLQTMREPE